MFYAKITTKFKSKARLKTLMSAINTDVSITLEVLSDKTREEE